EHAPHQLAGYARLANLLQNRLEQGLRARQVLDRMVTSNNESYQAYLIRARFYRDRGPLAQAVDDIARARQLPPLEPDVLLEAAGFARASGKTEETRRLLQEGVDLYPKNASLRLALANLEVQANQPDKAIACLEQGLRAVPDQADMLQAL